MNPPVNPPVHPLDASALRAYLARLGLAAPPATVEGLHALTEAHLRAVPFHNLALLANGGRDPGLPPVADAVAGAIAGRGGTCHQLSPPFVALLQALGFDAHLAAADVANPRDHLVGIVHLAGRTWLMDVANGQPYVPFPVDADVHLATVHGWHFHFGPVASPPPGALPAPPPSPGATHALHRRLPDGAWRRTYTLDPRPRTYASFEAIIREHHTRLGFGPFLTGLRAVRVTPDAVLVLRDDAYERMTHAGTTRRVVPDGAALTRLLAGPFGLADAPVDAALTTLRHTSPARWATWGAPAPDPVAAAEARAEAAGWTAPTLAAVRAAARAAPPRPDDPRVLLALTSTDRPVALGRFLRSLAAERRAFGLPVATFALLVLENGRPDNARRNARLLARARRAGLAVAHVRPPGSPTTRLPLAAARNALTAALVDWRDGRLAGGAILPRPADTLVWMLDDDLELQTLVATGGTIREVRPFSTWHRVVRLWRAHPEIAVALGGNTGAPPIPAHGALRTQLLDVREALRLARTLGPTAPWPLAENPRALPDYYYAHSEAGDAHLAVPFRYEPRAAGRRAKRSDAPPWLAVRPPATGRGNPAPLPVADVLRELLAALPTALVGQQVTRPLTYVGAFEPRPSIHRGGNALFFDADALAALPYPDVRVAGMPLRRGDTAWAAEMARRGYGIAAVPVPLLHGRVDATAGTEAEAPDPVALVEGILAQAYGTVVARLVAAPEAPSAPRAAELLEARLARLDADFVACHALLADLREHAATLQEAPGWCGFDAAPLPGFLAAAAARVPDAPLPRRAVAEALADAARAVRGASGGPR